MRAGILISSYGLVVVLSVPLAAQDSAKQATARDSIRCEWDPGCSSPGVHLTLKEVKRGSERRRSRIDYELVASGLPSTKLFTIWGNLIGGGPTALFAGVSGDSSGGWTCTDSTAHTADARPPGTHWCLYGFKLTFPAWGFAPSEPYRFALISTDETIRAYATAYPWPVEATSGTCHLLVGLVRRNEFAIHGEGFQPGEEVHTMSLSGQQVIEGTARADSAGRLPVALVLPAVVGKAGGKATYSVTAARCRLRLEYAWGGDLKAK